MALHLVGETISAPEAHRRNAAGELLPLVRGVYVEQADDIDAVVFRHAVRIANYLYPTAYLSSASAQLLGPTADGRLFITGRRNQRLRLRSLEIIQNQAPDHPSLAKAVVGDDLGELHVRASSPSQRLLEAFRMRSEHAGAITPRMRAQVADQLVGLYGSPAAAADAVWTLARENGWYREGEGAERFLTSRPDAVPAPVNKAALDLLVAWHGEVIGRLIHDGVEWRWRPGERPAPPVVRETAPGKLPPFIESLLPEGWLANVLDARTDRDILRQGRRYLSNITIAGDPADLASQPADVLIASLADFTQGGAFVGTYAGPGRGEIETTFEENLARLFAKAATPRLSGVQIKAPMSLDSRGVLAPAVDLPFTHIFKPAGTGGFQLLPVVEWVCLTLGRRVGFETPAIALIDMPEAMPPALVVERFDIRRGPDDTRRMAMEDFCSILDLPASAKYDGTIEKMARGMRPLSTDPAADIEVLFRRAVFAWLIADGDMHLKNLAMLKTAPARSRTFSSVRFAPLYDAVTTRVFPGLAADRMALKLRGKDDHLTHADFLGLAGVIGLSKSAAEAAIADLASGLADDAVAPPLPAFAAAYDGAEAARDRVLTIARARSAALLA